LNMGKCVRCGKTQGTVNCMSCPAWLCPACADTFMVCPRCELKRDEELKEKGRRERLDALQEAAGVQGMTKEQRMKLANIIYLETQRVLISIATEVCHMPLDSFINRIERSEALAPLVNPEVYIRGFKSMQTIKDLAQAINSIMDKLEDVALNAPADMETNGVWDGLGELQTFIRAKRQAKADREAAKKESREAKGEGGGGMTWEGQD